MIVIAKSEEHTLLIKSALIKCIRIIKEDHHLDDESLVFTTFLEKFYAQQPLDVLCNALKKAIVNESDTVDDATHYFCHNSIAKSYHKLKINNIITQQTKVKLNSQFDLLKMAVLKL